MVLILLRNHHPTEYIGYSLGDNIFGLIICTFTPSAGTELYRERLVRALAQDLQVPLLVLDSSVLAPYVRL